MRLQAFSLMAPALACAACSNPSSEPGKPGIVAAPIVTYVDGVQQARFSGPGIFCGLGFAFELASNEQVVRYDRQMDFLTYSLENPRGSAVIHVGNANQPADIELDTGRQFPSVIAVHLAGGAYDRSLKDRILRKGMIPASCSLQTAD